jgi:hypothetical protein
MDHIRGVSCETSLISGERPKSDVPMNLDVFDQADSVATYPTTAFRKNDGVVTKESM